MTRITFALVLVCLACTSTLFADDSTTNATTGTITGVVLDAQGNPAKDCIVIAQQANEKMREPLSATTDEKGAFKIDDVPEGDYNLNVRTPDLKSKAIKSLSVIAGKTANVGKLKLKTK
jgi:5-hydroxyisourate hydrolase-like protein (transthyretin family)